MRGGFPDGFLSVNTKNISLFHIGSTWTATVGHSAALYGASDITNFAFPQTSRWLVQEGTVSVVGSLVTSAVTFATVYKAAPVVFLQGSDPRAGTGSGGTAGFSVLGVSAATIGGFTSTFSDVFSTISGYSWRAEGIAAL